MTSLPIALSTAETTLGDPQPGDPQLGDPQLGEPQACPPPRAGEASVAWPTEGGRGVTPPLRPSRAEPAPPTSPARGGGQPDPARPSVDVVTFGCRLNAYESEVMRGHVADAGLADAVVVNTCAVTAEAVRQARQAIRKLRRERPEARIVVTGCAAQTDPAAFAAMPEVDLVLGNAEKMDARTWKGLGNHPPRAFPGAPTTEKIRVDDIMSVKETAGHLIDGLADRARAYIQVQNGCDHRCTFCIIPYGRGNSRSVPAGEIVTQVRRLADNGVAEVVLTGVDITSWGGDLPGTPKLGRLVRAILDGVPNLPRLRLSSLDAVEIDPELFDFVTEEPRVAPHLHLSLQAGDDMILKRMKRRHLRQDAVELCARLKAARPELAFGADLIAGFPTEDEAMFENTLALVDDCDLAFAHVFPFSPRPGTPAARMPQLTREIVKHRAARLRAKGTEALARHLGKHVGTQSDVLVERDGFARLADFSPLRLAPSPARPGSILRARILAHDGVELAGEVLASREILAQ